MGRTLVDEARVGPAINRTAFPNTRYGSRSNNWYWANRVYGTSAFFKATGWWQMPLWLYCALFYTMVFGATFLLAHLSYRFLESPFLRLKDQRFSPLPPSPHGA